MLNPNPFATISPDANLSERPGEAGMTVEGATVGGAQCDPFAVGDDIARQILTSIEAGEMAEVVLSGDGLRALGIVRPQAA